MKPVWRHIIGIGAIILAASGLVVLTTAAGRAHRIPDCHDLEVHFADEYRFVDEDEVRKLVFEGYGNYIGVKADRIGLAGVEKVLNSRSSVSSSEAWVTDDGILHIKIWQRVPVVLLRNGENGCYVDKDAFTFPMTGGYKADVPQIDGEWPEDEAWLRDIVEMIRIKGASTLEAARIDSMTTRGGEIFLHPSSGRETFLFGKPVQVESKLARMQAYYDHIVAGADSTAYTKVNLKYKGQIICR